jgi:hypothetical protein
MSEPLSVETEVQNLLCVPIDAWRFVEPYARIVLARCHAKEEKLARTAPEEQQALLQLRMQLQSRLGERAS